MKHLQSFKGLGQDNKASTVSLAISPRKSVSLGGVLRCVFARLVFTNEGSVDGATAIAEKNSAADGQSLVGRNP
jgi:hypothetical protein